jgi:hypothetical protein
MVLQAGDDIRLFAGGGIVECNAARFTEVADPVDDQDAATKKYVDDAIAAAL